MLNSGPRTIKYFVSGLLLILSVAGCGESETPATHPSLRTANLPRLISAKEFYLSGYKSWAHLLSPDGQKLAWIRHLQGNPTLHVRQLDGQAETVVRHAAPVVRFYWARDSRHLLFLADSGGAEHLFVADTDSPQTVPRDLTPFDSVRVGSILAPPSKIGSVLVEMNLGAGPRYDLYEIHLNTGRHKLIQRDYGRTLRWIVSCSGGVVARIQVLKSGGWELQALDGKGGWRRVLAGKFGDTIVVADKIPEDGTTLYAKTNAGRDTIAVVKLNLEDGRQEVAFETPDADVSRFWINPSTDQLLAVLYHDSLPRYHYHDRRMQEDLEGLLGSAPLFYTIGSASADRRRLVIVTETDRTAPSTYLIDRDSKEKELLESHPLSEFATLLSRTRPVRFTARDGLPISGYLTLPRGTSGRNLPLVLKVHGGPWSRDVWRFDLDTQFLANRGYAVLEVNFRGSMGFGKVFVRKARKEFGRKMQDDLIDAVDWAVAEGYADPAKVAIFGYSYGGYAALMGLAMTPRKFAAGVDVMGMSDLALQVRAFPPDSWGPRTWWVRFVGDPNDPNEHKELMERSPITHAHRIERPLLVVHGAKDGRVSRENSDRLVRSLRENDVPVEYLVFADEGHGISKRQNRIQFAHRLETFLARYLDGRAGPMDYSK